jgi:hypothetical protein
MENLPQHQRPHHQTVLIPWIKFWQPPEKVVIPLAPADHHYIPLHESATRANYETNLAMFPALSEVLNSTAYTSVVTSASFALKTPYFKYTFIRFFILGLFIYYFIRFLVSCLTGDIFGLIIYLLLIGLCPFGMRLGGKQYLDRMQKYEKVLHKLCHNLSTTVLAGSGLVVEPGYRCLWLDFHTGGYAPPPVPSAFVQNPVYYFPGTQVSNV